MKNEHYTRMCVACRGRKPKTEMLRCVNRAGIICPDPAQTAQARGAYLCKDPACITKAEKTHALERHLQGSVSADFYDELRRKL